MGMFDYIKIPKNDLGITEDEWQTKNLECDLNKYEIKDNILYLIWSPYEKLVPKKIDLTGIIRLCNNHGYIYVKFENGKLIEKVTQKDYEER